MTFIRVIYTCAFRSRCPCCGKGKLFKGWFAFRPACEACGLIFEQWVGDWTSPTWIAHSAGFLTALALFIWLFAKGVRVGGPIPEELLLAIVAGVFSLLSLRPSKAVWLGFMYWVGGVEVSARTRAWLHWSILRDREPGTSALLKDAESRARRAPAAAASGNTRGGAPAPTLKDLRFPRPR